MNENEFISMLMDKYADLQRIKKSDDAQKEIDYQIKLVKAKLESMGIVTTDLDIE